MDTNFFLNLITSTGCGAAAAAVTLVTAEDTDKEVMIDDCQNNVCDAAWCGAS